MASSYAGETGSTSKEKKEKEMNRGEQETKEVGHAE